MKKHYYAAIVPNGWIYGPEKFIVFDNIKQRNMYVDLHKENGAKKISSRIFNSLAGLVPYVDESEA